MNNKRDEPVYMISVAARLVGVHPQTLRIYERKRLLMPGRTPKSTRLYSDRDIERLKLIQRLTQDEGINLAGVKMIMELQVQVEEIQATVKQMEVYIDEVRARMIEEIEQVHRSYRRDLVPVPRGALARRTP